MAEIGTDIIKAKELLNMGKLVAIPTETVYGLAGNALDPNAVIKIFQVKNRPSFDPLIIHVHHLESVYRFAESIPETLSILAEKFWPGPLTLILKKTHFIPDIVTSGLDTVAVRMPAHPLTLHLLESLDYPLAAPSANPFGYISPTTAHHVNDQLGNKIRYILDGGPCSIGLESTIVGCENNKVIVYRLGGKSLEDIESVSGKVEIRSSEELMPIAPGMLKSHYAPKKRVILYKNELPEEAKGNKRAGVLSFKAFATDLPAENHYYLSARGDLREAGKNLFTGLRLLDSLDIDVIFAELVPDFDLGKAINDRLKKASSNN